MRVKLSNFCYFPSLCSCHGTSSTRYVDYTGQEEVVHLRRQELGDVLKACTLEHLLPWGLWQRYFR